MGGTEIESYPGCVGSNKDKGGKTPYETGSTHDNTGSILSHHKKAQVVCQGNYRRLDSIVGLSGTIRNTVEPCHLLEGEKLVLAPQCAV